MTTVIERDKLEIHHNIKLYITSIVLNMGEPTLPTNHVVLESLRKESLDIYNRLHSIDEDCNFVKQLKVNYPNLPVVPNLRCGAWYVEPNDRAQNISGAYFKSTDGHNNNWAFNLRRPNLHLLSLFPSFPAILLVDSTRSGKRMPDALSKTLPLWCAVVNRAVSMRYSYAEEWDTSLYTYPASVSPQEHAEIESRIKDWAISLANSSYDLPKLAHPLRPLWVTPATSHLPAPLPNFYSIICVSASKWVKDGDRQHGFAYIQGSGDDHETWGMGLTPDLYWKNKDMLLNTTRAELPNAIQRVAVDTSSSSAVSFSEIGTTRLVVCKLADISTIPSDSRQSFLRIYPTEDFVVDTDQKAVLDLFLPLGKRGQMLFLHDTLPRSMGFISTELSKDSERHVYIACDDGKDASVGVALCALQSFFDARGEFQLERKNLQATKDSIRTRLQWIISSRPEANPSRTTLKRVNEFLLSPPAFRPR